MEQDAHAADPLELALDELDQQECCHRHVNCVLASLGSPRLCLCHPHDWNDDVLQSKDLFGPRIIIWCVELEEGRRAFVPLGIRARPNECG